MTTRKEIEDKLFLVNRRRDELNDALMLFDELEGNTILINYINYESEYKFRADNILTAGTRRNSTYLVSGQEFDNCLYLNLGKRKCDIFNDSHLAGLKKALKESEKIHNNIDKIKKGEY